MKLTDYTHIYFIGIGGIGMSALARYFHANDFFVAGYDKTQTPLTLQLENEGIDVHYTDDGDAVVQTYRSEKTLVIYTPAVPKTLQELISFRTNGFHCIKRAKALGLITENTKGLGVAGTHGKTTTSTLLAHVLDQSHLGCNAFLGGIATNFNSNLVLNTASDLSVIEADEFDQSFLALKPYASIITSTDADHLDIYSNAQHLIDSFQKYADLTAVDGIVIKEINATVNPKQNYITYALDDSKADYCSSNLRYAENTFFFDCIFGDSEWKNIALGIPGIHNVANATAVLALCIHLGLSENEIRTGLATFKGVKRRFEYHIQNENCVYIDDYAHHPTEIKALIDSVDLLYPTKKKIGVFQPHLFSRTRDFMKDFAKELSAVDELILLPIYPAREEPLEGVTSEALAKLINKSAVQVLQPEAALASIKNTKQNAVYLTIGAGNIDTIIQPLKAILQ